MLSALKIRRPTPRYYRNKSPHSHGFTVNLVPVHAVLPWSWSPFPRCYCELCPHYRRLTAVTAGKPWSPSPCSSLTTAEQLAQQDLWNVNQHQQAATCCNGVKIISWIPLAWTAFAVDTSTHPMDRDGGILYLGYPSICAGVFGIQYRKASQSPKHTGTDCSPKSPVHSSCISPTSLSLATGYLMHQVQTGNYFL